MSGQSVIVQETLQTVSLGAHFDITPGGLFVKGRPSFEAFAGLGETLRTLDRSLQFVIGDFFSEVERRFGDESGLPPEDRKASQILDHTNWSESTLRAYRWTADNVPKENRRMDVLTYSHHQAVAKLPPPVQKKWLTQAAQSDCAGKPWPVARLKAAIKANGDQPVMTWVCVAFCDSEGQRDNLLRELESRGIRCKASEKRGEKGA